MAEYNTEVRVFDHNGEAKATIENLQWSGFAMNQLSIVGKDYHTEKRVIGYHNAGDRMKAWKNLGSFWGGLSGLLLGSGFYVIPAIGPVIVFGPLVSWIVTALQGAVMAGELSALGAGLHSIGIPKHGIMEYETALKYDKFIVIAHGIPNEITKPQTVRESSDLAQIVPRPSGELRQLA